MFCKNLWFLKDVNKLKEKGLILGGSLKNAIVLDDTKILNKDGLRFTDEFVRHKVLDFIGDISLAGYKILGSFFTSHSGHELNLKLLKEILVLMKTGSLSPLTKF